MDFNLSARLHGSLDLRLEKQSIPVPADGEAVIRIRNCGICGTDVHMWKTGLCGNNVYVTDPVVIGHECSGVVHSVADDVNNLKIGDSVAVELGLPCSKCDLCRRGKYNLCKPFSIGGLTRYLKYNAGFCHRLPDTVSFEAGALIEPLAVGVRACKRASVRIGTVVLICGAGAIGLSCLLAARAMGASAVCLTDISQSRLDLASSMGANWTVLVNPEYMETSKELAGRITRTIGCRPDSSIECSGNPSSLQAAIYATKSGGVMAPVALDPTHVDLPILDAATREVDIRGVFSYCNDYPAAISMLASGRIDPTPMITTRFPLEDVMEAFQRARDRKDGDVKVMINCE